MSNDHRILFFLKRELKNFFLILLMNSIFHVRMLVGKRKNKIFLISCVVSLPLVNRIFHNVRLLCDILFLYSLH